MSKFSIDDLVEAQQRTESQLKLIALLLTKDKPSPLLEFANFFLAVCAVLVFIVGLFMCYEQKLLGLGLCMFAGLVRIEKLLSK